jgi:hypothetical protein
VTRTVADHEVVSGATPQAGWSRAQARAWIRRAVGQVPGDGRHLVRRWHGFALTQSGDQTWTRSPAYDDWVLISVCLPTDAAVATERPALPRATSARVGERSDREARHLRT